MRRTVFIFLVLLVADAAGGWPWSRGPAPVTIAAVGDIMLDRRIARTMRTRGPEAMVARICDLISSADLAIGNLECPLARRSDRIEKAIAFRASPDAVRCLVEGGLDVVTLANNHTLDCGREGLRETMVVLGTAGMRWCGAGEDRAAAERATIIEVRGRRVAFVGFCEFMEGERKWDHTPTIALAEEETVRRAVAAARGEADSVVASFHWGEEYDERPNRLQCRLAAAAVHAGADLVIGHHPHVLQGFQFLTRTGSGARRRALVAYSLGNFIFDQKRDGTRESVVLNATLGRDGVEAATLVPVALEGYRPRPAGPAAEAAILARLERLSRAFRTRIDGRAVRPAAE